LSIKVVHVITKLELGGAQRNTLFTLSNLDRSRYSPVLVHGPGGEMLEEAAAIPGVERYMVRSLVREISPFKDFLAIAGLYAIFRRAVKTSGGLPVIAHTHSSKAGILGRLAAYLAGVPIIVHTVHGYGFNDWQARFKRTVLVLAERAVSPFTTYFVAVAGDNIEKGVREGILSRDKACVIRSGIDTRYFETRPGDAPAVRHSLGVPEGAPLAVMVSCLKPQKAPVDFVRVAARVLEKVPGAHFVQVGDGELRGEVESEAERLGIAERFHLLGWRRDVRDIIHACDVVVLTSLWEGLPRVVPEAMAAGKPVVATSVDGTPEAVKDGVNGFLAAPHDVDTMAKRLAALLGDRGLAARMGAAGRDMVSEFDESEMLRRIEALYDGLLKGAL
jgi:glycosyltransferase involved in cell wall biosynthesis